MEKSCKEEVREQKLGGGHFSNLGTLNFSVKLYKVKKLYKNLETLCVVQQNNTVR